MPPFKWLVALAAAGLVSIFVLGRMPLLEPQLQELRRTAAVSAPYRPITLSDDNLVDAVAALRLHHRLTRVGWDHSILTLDITLRENGNAVAGLQRDIASVLRFSFEETDNVHQTLIRVYRSTADRRRELLFYGDPRREELANARATGISAEGSGELRQLLEVYRLAATPAGKRWLEVLAN